MPAVARLAMPASDAVLSPVCGMAGLLADELSAGASAGLPLDGLEGAPPASACFSTMVNVVEAVPVSDSMASS